MAEIFGAVLEYLRARFKGELGHDELEFTVGTQAVLVAPGSGERVSITFVNLGATQLYLSPSLQASTTHGLRLAANGGTVSMNVEEDSLLPALCLCASGSGADGVLFVLTVFRSSIERVAE